MAQEEFRLGKIGNKTVLLITGVPGPASYLAATGFPVVAKTLRKVDAVLSWQPEVGTAVADRNQRVDTPVISATVPNTIKFIVTVQVVTGAGGAATWAVVADAQDLSATLLRVVVLGE